MKTLNDICLLFEAIKLNNEDATIDAIKTNTVGAKINKEYKNLNNNTESVIRKYLGTFFKKCSEFKISETTFGVQYLLGHTSDSNINSAVNNDALYTFLKNKKTEWVKNLPSYNKMLVSQYDEGLWQTFENEFNKEYESHGERRFTNTNNGNVKTLYNKNNWALYMPLNYEGECSVAYDAKGKAGWCTRQRGMYDRYTQNGKTHLYVIRNLKEGDAYQIAFMGNSVEFFDSIDGDEHAYSSSSKESPKLYTAIDRIPDEILKLVKDENEKDGRTLLDFKNALSKSKENKKYIKPENAYDFFDEDNYVKPIFGKPEHVSGDVYKVRVLNYTREDIGKLSKYFKRKVMIREEYENDKIHKNLKKEYMYLYYDKNNPRFKLFINPKNNLAIMAIKDNKYFGIFSTFNDNDDDETTGVPNYSYIKEIAKIDSGYYKTVDRINNHNISRKIKRNNLEKELIKKIEKIFKIKINKIFKLTVHWGYENRPGKKIKIYCDNEDEDLITLKLLDNKTKKCTTTFYDKEENSKIVNIFNSKSYDFWERIIDPIFNY